MEHFIFFFLTKMTVELRNITSTGQHVRLIPPSTSVFFIWPGKGSLSAFEMLTHTKSNLPANKDFPEKLCMVLLSIVLSSLEADI